jgi:glycosyltransferase involved in cell wall biosynthesis
MRSARVKPRISVVIPVYNEGEAIIACLEPIHREVLPSSEILVVHDMPDDTTLPYAKRAGATYPFARTGPTRTGEDLPTRSASASTPPPARSSWCALASRSVWS